jgi:hypothetical protein
MKKLFLILAISFSFSIISAQEVEVIETEFRVSGVCDMCKERIEKAVDIDEVKYSKWNKRNKMLFVAFESTVTADSLQKRIAAVGHDTEKYKAAETDYVNLPKCCSYRHNVKTH